jgi:myosin protein heavy chain
MASHTQNVARWQRGSFGRTANSPSPGPAPAHTRSKSSVMPSSRPLSPPPGHSRTNSLADLGLSSLIRPDSKGTTRAGSASVGTFAPKFINSEGTDGTQEKVGGIEGENDFSGKRYVWVKDQAYAFVRGWVVEELSKTTIRVQCDDGSVSDDRRDCRVRTDKGQATRCRIRKCGQGQSGQV